ncbi:WD domain, G-beta repeat [Novymonas esmeraldas]|uniref:WD domain, G-beta repeat n=1 Tax=Novymonas esmeraldas TaxID=1808958 RepID=A0AAW0F355_9TRYP
MESLITQHKTYVHHIALDPSGALLASCSSDKTVEVFHRRTIAGGGAMWEPGCAMHDHSGPVLRMAWCQHREHGPLLATAGADRWIYIYRIIVSSHEGRTLLHTVRWTPVRGYEKDVITDVAFVPPQQYHVLLLSTASLDGCVRLYEVHQPQQFPCVCRISPEADAAAAEAAGDGGGGGGGGSGGGGAVVVVSLPTAAGAAPSSVGAASGHCEEAPASPSTVAVPMLRSGGVTAIGWFPGAAERTMTLAVGTVSGRFFLYRYIKDSNTFMPIPVPHVEAGTLRCRAPVCNVSWAPSVGRRFQLLAICSRREVFLLRLNCVSPSIDEDRSFELFRAPVGAVSAAWSRSSTLLYLAADDRHTQVVVLQMTNPLDHQSWQVVSRNARE